MDYNNLILLYSGCDHTFTFPREDRDLHANNVNLLWFLPEEEIYVAGMWKSLFEWLCIIDGHLGRNFVPRITLTLFSGHEAEAD